VVQEDPGQIEPAREVGGQRLDSEGFGRVMAAVKDVYAQFLRQRIGPMRPFAGDEGIHAFRRRLFQAVARAAAHDADPAADGGAGGDEVRRAAGGLPQAFGQVCPREAGLGLKPEVQSVVEVEGAQLSEAQRRAEAGVVAEAGMRVQRQVGTVNR